MNWFRLYSEARNDAKLRTLTDAEHRVWFNLICYAAEQKDQRGSIRDFDMDILAIEVANGDADLLLATLKKLDRLRIVRATDGGEITFLKFEERQYDKPSDRPSRVKERVQAHREKQKEGDTEQHETPSVDGSNALKRTETPCNAHTQNREYSENTDPPNPPVGGDGVEIAETQEAQKKPTPPLSVRFEQFWTAYPKKTGKGAAEKVWLRLRPGADVLALILAALSWQRGSPQWRKDGGQYIPNPATYLNAQGWLDEPDVDTAADLPPPKIAPPRDHNADALADMARVEATLGSNRPRFAPGVR